MKYYRKHDKKKFNMNIFIAVSVIWAIGITLYMYGTMYRAVVVEAINLGLGSLMLAATILIAMALALFFGTFQLNAAVFNARDVEWYAPMPLRQEAIFFSKFGIVYLIELAIAAFIMVPAYIFYSVEIGAGAGFWVLAVLTLPFVPIIPLAISALLALPLSKLAAKFRNRELITTVLMVVFVLALTVGSMMISVSIGRVAEGDLSIIENMFTDSEPVLRLMTSIFPPAMWLALGLTFANDAAVSLLLFLGVSVAVMTLTVYLAGKFYYSGVLAILETPPAKKKKSVKVLKTDKKAESPVLALTKSDFKQILRTPIYALNSFSGIFIGLIIFVMPLVMGSEWDTFKPMIVSAIINLDPALLLAITTLIGAAAGLINPAASTAFSRDGRAVWLMQTIPVPPKEQVTAKVLSSTAIAAISTAVIYTCLCVMFVELIPFAVMGLIPAIFISVSTSAMSMIPDILNPKLKWDNEAEAMKQNMNSLWGILTSLPAILIMLGILAVIAFTAPNLTFALIFLMLVTAGLAYGGVVIANKIAETRFKVKGERL
jgi:ABC-2 type transport system permease protein